MIGKPERIAQFSIMHFTFGTAVSCTSKVNRTLLYDIVLGQNNTESVLKDINFGNFVNSEF